MFSVLGDVDWLAFVVAVVLSVALAAVWFPVVIAKPYAVALGREGAPPAPQTPVVMFGPIVCIVVTVLTSAVLIKALGVTTIGDAVLFGLIVGIGYLSAMTFQIAINPNFPRPLLYGVLNAPYFVVASVLSSVVLVALS